MFELTSDLAFDLKSKERELWDARAGGAVTFEGLVRNHNEGRDVLSLEYEAYEELAQKEGERIVGEALENFSLHSAYCVHWTGHLEIGERAVWIYATASHRAEAFRACQYIIDEVKSRVPIWKKEHYADGQASWVRCDNCAKHHSHPF